MERYPNELEDYPEPTHKSVINWDLLEELLKDKTEDQLIEIIEEIGSSITEPETWQKVFNFAKECLLEYTKEEE